MDESYIRSLLKKQREFFSTNLTKKVSFRKAQLKKLYASIVENEEEIKKALFEDFKKPFFETYTTEIGLVLHEIRYILKHLSSWARPVKVKSPLFSFPSKSFILNEPYGVVLIISPWNYPFQLSISPLAGAIAAGNCAVLKTSPLAIHTSGILKRIFKEIFLDEYVALIEGHRDVNKILLSQKFDLIFFTGSPEVGKVVMEYASKNLTPVVLELGGKSPVVVTEDANVKIAARRILWGKMVNAGQTCVAPDYLLVHNNVKEALIEEIKKQIKLFYSKNLKDSKDIAHIVSEKNYQRLISYTEEGRILNDYYHHKGNHYLTFVMIDNVSSDSKVMKEEIFGPVLPVIGFSNDEEAIEFILSREKPLAFYIFTSSKKREKFYLERISCGGVCINETVMHVANHLLPFGGIGNSGMGRYHGRFSFETFSNKKAVLKGSNFIDFNLRYPPYTKFKEFLARLFLR
jgi:aldehyde dehydrogenase (NAD+)